MLLHRYNARDIACLVFPVIFSMKYVVAEKYIVAESNNIKTGIYERTGKGDKVKEWGLSFESI